MVNNLQDELEKSKNQQIKKERDYYSWLNRNSHASNRQKRNAKAQFTFANNFYMHDIKKK